jgi:tetratricopeptide (TPR) repeat protein
VIDSVGEIKLKFIASKICRNYQYVILMALSLLSVLLLSACSSTSKNSESSKLFQILDKADAAYAEGNWLEAEMYYQQLINKVPDDAYAWLRVGNARLQQGQISSAIAAYQQSITHNPGQTKPYFNLSTAYMLQAQRALEVAKNNLQKHDPGLALVNHRIDGLKALSTSGYSNSEVQSTQSDRDNGVVRYFMPPH